MLVDAATLVGASVVRHTADGDALSPGVATRTWGTDAHGLVVHTLALGLRPTRFVVGSTHRDTLGILAGVGARAVVVAETPNVVASNFWVSLVARHASTNRMMFDDLAGCSSSTLAWIFAETIDTSLFGRTLRVSFANWSDYRNQRAKSFFFDNHAVLTNAYHCPHWEGVNHSTLRRVMAWFEVVTRVLTSFVDTG